MSLHPLVHRIIMYETTAQVRGQVVDMLVADYIYRVGHHDVLLFVIVHTIKEIVYMLKNNYFSWLQYTCRFVFVFCFFCFCFFFVFFVLFCF